MILRGFLVELLRGYYGECQKGKSNTTTPVVETSKRLEASVLEVRTQGTAERHQ